MAEKCPTCNPDTVPNSGPAPVLLRFNDLKLATPMWEDLTKWIETHEEQKKQLGESVEASHLDTHMRP